MIDASLIDYVAEPDLGVISRTGWIPPEDMAFDDWEHTLRGFIEAQNSLNWLVGDGLNYGERKWGEMYAQAILVTDWAYQRLADAKWVAAAVPQENRRDNLTWTHHKHVAKLPPVAQDEWLAQADENGWSTAELRGRMNGTKKLPEPDVVIEPAPRDAKRLFVELATIMATGEDAVQWSRTLSRREYEQLIGCQILAGELTKTLSRLVRNYEKESEGY